MKPTYILAIDQGTTSSRAILFDKNGTIVKIAQKEFTQYFPKSGWVNHEGNEIWESVKQVVLEILKSYPKETIAAIGITNQRETTLLWERATGKPVAPAIVWQSRQTVPICQKLKDEGYENLYREATGLVVDAYFSGTKIRAILDAIPEGQARAERGELCFGTIETWILWNLTGGKKHLTDISNASRTLLFNLQTKTWDPRLLAPLNIPSKMLPEIVSNSELIGVVGEQFPEASGLPISGMAGDQHAALFGQACFLPGEAKNTYGTGCFLLMNMGEKPVLSHNGLLTTIAYQLKDKTFYALEGSVFVAGSAIQWLRDGLKILDKASDSEAMAQEVSDSAGVFVVPAFVGLGAPYWDPEARGSILGLTRGTTKAHLIRATLESLAFQTRDIVTAMEQDAGFKLASLSVDGGAVKNNLLMQFQSDLLGVPVKRPLVQETTAFGVAAFAGLAVGFWNRPEDFKADLKIEKIFSPSPDRASFERKYQHWQKAVEATRLFKIEG